MSNATDHDFAKKIYDAQHPRPGPCTLGIISGQKIITKARRKEKAIKRKERRAAVKTGLIAFLVLALIAAVVGAILVLGG